MARPMVERKVTATADADMVMTCSEFDRFGAERFLDWAERNGLKAAMEAAAEAWIEENIGEFEAHEDSVAEDLYWDMKIHAYMNGD